ncbi:MAG: hypothetical protein ABI867_29265 [Kofleriaceae bacterium]
MKIMLRVLVVMLAIGFGTASARGMKAWSYRELVDAADVVAIVTPTKTKLRTEKAPLPEMPSVSATRVETEFAIVAVVKGKPADAKKLLLHHYADTRAGAIPNGPLLVAFEPKDKAQYLVFLKQGADGQYVAVTGQTDPMFSFEKLQQRAP